MKAVLIYGPRDVRVEEIPTPEPGSGEVLIRVRAAGICGSDLHFHRQQASGAWQRRNTAAGHEIAGDVVALGEGVTRVEVGDRVGVEPLIGCGQCPQCAAGQYHRCPQLRHIGGRDWSGGFAEYCKAPQEKVFPLPEPVTYEEAALGDGFAVAIHAMQRVPVPGRSVIVLGDGAIGQAVMQAARTYGADKVALVGHHDHALQVAQATGADLTVNERDADWQETLQEWTEGQGAEVVFETVGGTAPTLQQALEVARPGGRVGVVGSFLQSPPFNFSLFLRQEIALVPVWSYALWEGVPEYQIALDLLAQGQFQARPLITHRFPLEGASEAFAAALNKGQSRAIKVLLLPSGPC
ncbi:MAG TPA: hypothetical protein EYP85_09835 [Armatimonadetes bacterium]|nr:hypothetical protein [Armatimonadota bacterium]